MWQAIAAIAAMALAVFTYAVSGRKDRTKVKIARLERGLREAQKIRSLHISGGCTLKPDEYLLLLEEIRDITEQLRVLRSGRSSD